MLDLDGFKAINDSFGHLAGDECLKQIAMRLRLMFKGDHVVARVGGDEFAVLIRGPRTRAKIEAAVRQIIGDIKRPMLWRERTFEVGASVGVTLMTPGPNARRPSQIFTEADAALHAAKHAGRDTFRIHDPEGRTPREITPSVPVPARPTGLGLSPN